MTAAAEIIAPNEDDAFILGNGPSLAGVRLADLPSATFGMNAAYRYWREIDWRPTHYACLDLVVGMSHKDAIAALIDEERIGAFLLRDNLIAALGERARNAKIVNFDALCARDALFEGVTVTTGSGAALWAASLGRRRLIMLGVDGRYRQIVDGAEKRAGIELEIVQTADNPNYFYDGYQQPGDRYNLPDPRPALHVNAWREAGRKLSAAGVEVYNASPASAVRCFPFIDIDAFLTGGARPAPADEPLTERGASATTEEEGDVGDGSQTGRQRLAAFARRTFPLILGLGGVLLMLIVLWTRAAAPSMAALTSVVLAAGLLFAMAVGGLYARFALIAHLHALSREVAQLKARLRDLERL